MTGLDTNILIDLLISDMPSHKVTTETIKTQNDHFCTTPTNIGECLRILTHPRIFPNPLKVTQAARALRELLEYYQIEILEEDTHWWKELPEIEEEIPALRGNEIIDARIALCLRAHNVKKIRTRDADFKKYPFLKALDFKKSSR